MKENFRFKFTFRGHYYGVYSTRIYSLKPIEKKHSIRLNLAAFAKGTHVNDGHDNMFRKNPIEDDIIGDIIYTLNHEYIHYVTEKGEPHNSLQSEYLVYYMIGNGGNGFFNEYYKIAHHKAWFKEGGDYIG